MLKLWKALFGRRRAIREALETALADQFAWEKVHPIPYTRDQRIVAIAQRAEKLLKEAKRKPPRAIAKLAGERILALDSAQTSTAVAPYRGEGKE